MGTLSLLELEGEVRSGLGGRTDLDSRLRTFINLGQQRLARIHDFEEMQIYSTTSVRNTGADNDRFIQVPTLREIYTFVLLDGANSRRLIGRTPQYMDTLVAKPEYWSRDWPTEYCRWGHILELFPLPVQDFEVRMRWSQWPIDLVEPTDKSQYNQKDEVIIELALASANYSLGKDNEGAKHESRAKALLGETKEQDASNPDITPVRRSSSSAVLGRPADYWNDPFVRENPNG